MAEGRVSPKKQIAFALRQAEQATAVAEIRRKMGIAEPTFYRWSEARSATNKDSAMGVPEIRRLKQLED